MDDEDYDGAWTVVRYGSRRRRERRTQTTRAPGRLTADPPSTSGSWYRQQDDWSSRQLHDRQATNIVGDSRDQREWREGHQHREPTNPTRHGWQRRNIRLTYERQNPADPRRSQTQQRAWRPATTSTNRPVPYVTHLDRLEISREITGGRKIDGQ